MEWLVSVLQKTEDKKTMPVTMVDIEMLWGKFWGENIGDKIPNTVSKEFYAVYLDSESDYTGKHTLIINYIGQFCRWFCATRIFFW